MTATVDDRLNDTVAREGESPYCELELHRELEELGKCSVGILWIWLAEHGCLKWLKLRRRAGLDSLTLTLTRSARGRRSVPSGADIHSFKQLEV